MSLDDDQLRITEQRITAVLRTVERDLREPVELWARVESRLDGSERRRRWFRLTLAAAVAMAVIIAVAVLRTGDRQTVSTDSQEAPTATIEAACASLLSMRQDVTPLPDDVVVLRFTIERIQAAFASAAAAVDSVAPSALSPSLRVARDGWRSIFEIDAQHRIQQAAVEIVDGSATAAREGADAALATMVVAVGELHDAGIGACDPNG